MARYRSAVDRVMRPETRRGEPRDKGLLAEIRDARGSPFYRKELRQPTNVSMVLVASGIAFLVFLLVVLVSLMCCFTMPFAVSFPAMVFPGVLVAEGMLYEFEHGTIESLLLTTAARNEIVFAKFGARLRPMVYVAIAVAVITALAGLFIGGSISVNEFEHTPAENVLWAAVGFGAGAAGGIVAGLLVLGQAATGGAFAIYTVITSRSRTSSYSLLMLIGAGISLAESVLFGALLGLGGVIMVAVAAESDMGEEGAMVTGIILAAVSLLAFAARTVILNWFVPLWVLRHCARRLDSIVLGGR